jgi:hypothetical protein
VQAARRWDALAQSHAKLLADEHSYAEHGHAELHAELHAEHGHAEVRLRTTAVGGEGSEAAYAAHALVSPHKLIKNGPANLCI